MTVYIFVKKRREEGTMEREEERWRMFKSLRVSTNKGFVNSKITTKSIINWEKKYTKIINWLQMLSHSVLDRMKTEKNKVLFEVSKNNAPNDANDNTTHRLCHTIEQACDYPVFPQLFPSQRFAIKRSLLNCSLLSDLPLSGLHTTRSLFSDAVACRHIIIMYHCE